MACSQERISEPERSTTELQSVESSGMRSQQLSEDVATEPYAARGDDASERACSKERIFMRNFVLQKLVAVQFTAESALGQELRSRVRDKFRPIGAPAANF